MKENVETIITKDTKKKPKSQIQIQQIEKKNTTKQ